METIPCCCDTFMLLVYIYSVYLAANIDQSIRPHVSDKQAASARRAGRNLWHQPEERYSSTFHIQVWTRYRVARALPNEEEAWPLARCIVSPRVPTVTWASSPEVQALPYLIWPSFRKRLCHPTQSHTRPRYYLTLHDTMVSAAVASGSWQVAIAVCLFFLIFTARWETGMVARC